MLMNRSPWLLRKPDDLPGTNPVVEPPVVEPPAAPAPAAPQPPAPEEPGDELLELIKRDPERAAKEIKELRIEAADKRAKLKKHEDDAKAANDAKLAEQGDFKKLFEEREQEVKDLKKARQDDSIRTAVILSAAKAGVADPEDAYKLADLSAVKVEGSGVTGVAEAIAALIAAKPYLVKLTSSAPADPPPSPRVSPTNPGGGPQMKADDLKKLTPQQIAAMKPEDIAAILAQK